MIFNDCFSNMWRINDFQSIFVDFNWIIMDGFLCVLKSIFKCSFRRIYCNITIIIIISHQRSEDKFNAHSLIIFILSLKKILMVRQYVAGSRIKYICHLMSLCDLWWLYKIS